MTLRRKAGLDDVRRLHAAMMSAASGSSDPRLERVFEAVPREAFLGPGPWQLSVGRAYLETPTADPVHLYQNVLVALDTAKGINNGEPFLHAAWIGAAAPEPGETVCHIGAGTGYYTALLSMLVLPGGHVRAFEIEPDLARRARDNLEPFEGVEIVCADATQTPLPPCDLVYVNAGVVAPPPAWLEALRPGGRMIFPWQPAPGIGLAVLVRRAGRGFSARAFMGSRFIPAVGASDPGARLRAPTPAEVRAVASVWLTRDRPPDETAVAVFAGLWFGREGVT